MLYILHQGSTATGRFSLFNNSGKGGATVVQSNPTPQPSTADAINAWVAAMPQVYETQMQYAPLEAAQSVALAQQFAQPYGQAMKSAQEAMYPGTSGLQETLAGQAQQGMTATDMPEWMKSQYRDEMKAALGTNVSSPIGADYISRGMQQQLFNQQKYYRDLGLSVAGRQPLSQPVTPSSSNYMSTFTPQSAMNFSQQGYGTYAQSARPLGFYQNSGGLFGSLFGS